VLEATGDYWRGAFYLLEDCLNVILVNAAHAKGLPGRKTDVSDSAWLCQMGECGLLKASFVPPEPIRQLRDLTRYRATLAAERTREASRLEKPRVPVAEMVDTKLADGRLDGYQYADMPDDRDTWRLVLRGLDHTATAGYQTGFASRTEAQREAIVSQFARGRLVGGAWDELNVTRAWSVVMRAALAAFYAHPWAWNEIGFGGPAYPRGFMRLGGPGGAVGVREPFEKPGATDEDPVQIVQDGER
jgi:transposase